MSRISDYIKEMVEIYGDKVTFTKSTYDENTLSFVPQALRGFYAEYSKVDLPFGYIYSIENSLKDSEAELFKSEGWFSFGFDVYFSYWLCLFTPDSDNLSFTCWDHEGGSEIGGAVYKDILEFLEDIRSEYEENKDEWE